MQAIENRDGTNVCSHLQLVLGQLNSSEKLDWVTYVSPPPDHSLLNDSGLLWTQHLASQQEGAHGWCCFVLYQYALALHPLIHANGWASLVV